jgi:hypothetical protein
MHESRLDAWVERRVLRYRNEPKWQRSLGNFGFGFIFIGALLNLALFMVVLVLGIESQYLYQPWWLTYLLLCCIAGWSWRFHGNRHRAEA